MASRTALNWESYLRSCSTNLRARSALDRSISRRRTKAQQPLVARGDFGDQVLHQRLVRKRRDMHVAVLQPLGAGIDDLALQHQHAFLARVGVDAGEADGKRRVERRAYPAQAVQQRIAGLERYLEGIDPGD